MSSTSGALTGEGYFTYDPGFVSTASCDSNITFIDGDAGTLLHRGYPIEQLAEQSDFLELCYLLLHGGLPSAADKAAFDAAVLAERGVPVGVKSMVEQFSRGAHPMGIMTALTGALAAEYHEGLDITDEGASDGDRAAVDRKDAGAGGAGPTGTARARAIYRPAMT